MCSWKTASFLVFDLSAAGKGIRREPFLSVRFSRRLSKTESAACPLFPPEPSANGRLRHEKRIRCPTVELRFLTASGRQKNASVSQSPSEKMRSKRRKRQKSGKFELPRYHSSSSCRQDALKGAVTPFLCYGSTRPYVLSCDFHTATPWRAPTAFPHVSHQPTSLCRKENRPIIHFLVFTVLYCSTSFFICQSGFWRNGVFTKKCLQSFYSLCSLFCNFSSRPQPLIFLLTFSPFPFIMTVSHTTFERRTAGCQRNIADCLCAASIST